MADCLHQQALHHHCMWMPKNFDPSPAMPRARTPQDYIIRSLAAATRPHRIGASSPGPRAHRPQCRSGQRKARAGIQRMVWQQQYMACTHARTDGRGTTPVEAYLELSSTEHHRPERSGADRRRRRANGDHDEQWWRGRCMCRTSAVGGGGGGVSSHGTASASNLFAQMYNKHVSLCRQESRNQHN